MKINVAFLVCLICAIVAITLFAVIATEQSFPIYNSSNQTSSYVDVTGNVGSEDSRFLWNNDGLALIGQAFVLFAAAAAALGLLKNDEETSHA
jgi:amino acid permease